MNDYSKRILLIEDDQDIRELLGDLFTQEGYHVFEACDGTEALAEMETRRYDVVLTDYHMPRMDGLTFLEISRATWPETPVIVASCDPIIMEPASHMALYHAHARLAKPFDLTQLLNIVHDAAYRAADQELQGAR